MIAKGSGGRYLGNGVTTTTAVKEERHLDFHLGMGIGVEVRDNLPIKEEALGRGKRREWE